MHATIDVGYVAELARLALTDEERALFQRQLETIVQYVEKVAMLDVAGVEPTSHGRSASNIYREDAVEPSLDRDRALAIAPARHGFEFKLPKIVEEA